MMRCRRTCRLLIWASVHGEGRPDEHRRANQNTPSVALDAVSNYHYGELLGACLPDGELGRLALTCHFALDCLCELWSMFVEVDGNLSDGVITGSDVPVVQWWEPTPGEGI